MSSKPTTQIIPSSEVKRALKRARKHVNRTRWLAAGGGAVVTDVYPALNTEDFFRNLEG